MKKIRFRYLLLGTTLVATLFMFVNYQAQMTVRQNLLRWMYPVISSISRIAGANSDRIVQQNPITPPLPVADMTIQLIDGTLIRLGDLQGKKVMLVNTASDCGYTGQYEGLQALQERLSDKLVIIGFPSNDFKEQEKGTDQEIASFCKKNYGVRFPLSQKSVVKKQEGQHPLFRWLTDPVQNGWNSREPGWNFSKYILDEDGRLVAYFGTAVDPMSEDVMKVLAPEVGNPIHNN